MSKPKKVALAYSGGLDTSVIIPWLKENYGCEVVAVCGDIGQGGDELTGLEEKARKTGASEVYVEDMREEFVSQYLWKLVRSGGVYEHKYLLGTSIARPLLAKKQVEVALKSGCDALAHGCTGKGNDQVRFELTYKALAPQLAVIAPWREWTIVSREDAIEYARAHHVPISASTTKIYSRDRNIWHISHEGGALEDPANAAPDEIWMLTKSPAEAPDTPGEVAIGFEKGVPVSKPIATSPGVSGASAGLLVSIQISSGAALAGSSSAPPSCEMCQILRSRLYILVVLAEIGTLCARAYSIASSRETIFHSRHGAITGNCGASAL